MRLIRLLTYLILIIIGVSFAALNATSVSVNFYLRSYTFPISVLMAIVLGVGILIGFLLFLFRYWKIKMECQKLKNQLKWTEQEIKNLRSIPIQDQH